MLAVRLSNKKREEVGQKPCEQILDYPIVPYGLALGMIFFFLTQQ